MYHEQTTYCPYCGESFTGFIDISQGNYRTIEDCYVCCQPIEMLIESDGESLLRFEAFTCDEVVY